MGLMDWINPEGSYRMQVGRANLEALPQQIEMAQMKRRQQMDQMRLQEELRGKLAEAYNNRRFNYQIAPEQQGMQPAPSGSLADLFAQPNKMTPSVVRNDLQGRISGESTYQPDRLRADLLRQKGYEDEARTAEVGDVDAVGKKIAIIQKIASINPKIGTAMWNKDADLAGRFGQTQHMGEDDDYHYFQTGNVVGRVNKRSGAAEELYKGPEKPDQMEMLLKREELAGIRQDRQFQQQEQMQDRREAAADRRLNKTLAATAERASKKSASKPMPAAALKMQQEELDALGTAEGIKSDLGAVLTQLNSGKLDLGPVSNLIAKGRNATGMSNESSRNFASFRSTLEKLRNDSLRLNKGVQTEGDAQRAWNELFEGINDPALVKQRIDEIQRINDRAATLRQMNVENIRNNYGQDALETGGYKAPAPVLGPKKQQQKPTAQKSQRPLSGPAQAVINKYRGN